MEFKRESLVLGEWKPGTRVIEASTLAWHNGNPAGVVHNGRDGQFHPLVVDPEKGGIIENRDKNGNLIPFPTLAEAQAWVMGELERMCAEQAKRLEGKSC